MEYEICRDPAEPGRVSYPSLPSRRPPQDRRPLPSKVDLPTFFRLFPEGSARKKTAKNRTPVLAPKKTSRRAPSNFGRPFFSRMAKKTRISRWNFRFFQPFSENAKMSQNQNIYYTFGRSEGPKTDPESVRTSTSARDGGKNAKKTARHGRRHRLLQPPTRFLSILRSRPGPKIP